MKNKGTPNRLLFLVPVLGTGFVIAYLLAATKSVVYSDYIRLVNSYLPDVWNPKKFFVADIFTRIPVNFPVRIINVYLFGYSATFDMILGALCLGLAGAVLTAYCIRKKIGTGWYLTVMAVFFSLNKWEMLTNGTGWCHFLAFAGFYFHFFLWDQIWTQAENAEERKTKRKRRLLIILPWLITLGTAGPYCGSYSAVMLLTLTLCYFLDKKSSRKPQQPYLLYGLSVLLPLILYLISSSFAVSEHAGATGRGIAQVLRDNTALFPKFILKGLSSMILGEQTMMELLQKLDRGMALCYLAGLLVLAGYLLALYLQLKNQLYKTSILPLMLLASGVLNHLLVLAARWIFENSSYGMSSRYALQYQAGILGMLLTFSLFFQQEKAEPQSPQEFPDSNSNDQYSSQDDLPSQAFSSRSGNYQYSSGGKGLSREEPLRRRRRLTRSILRGTRREPGGFLRMVPSLASAASDAERERGDDGTRPCRSGRASLWKAASLIISLVILAGNGYTTGKELKMAVYRKEYAAKVEDAALHYREVEDDVLEDLFQYRHGPEKIRQALQILEEEKWNVYGGN